MTTPTFIEVAYADPVQFKTQTFHSYEELDQFIKQRKQKFIEVNNVDLLKKNSRYEGYCKDLDTLYIQWDNAIVYCKLTGEEEFGSDENFNIQLAKKKRDLGISWKKTESKVVSNG